MYDVTFINDKRHREWTFDNLQSLTFNKSGYCIIKCDNFQTVESMAVIDKIIIRKEGK